MRRLFRIAVCAAVGYALAGCVIVLPSRAPNGDMSTSPRITATPLRPTPQRTTPSATPRQPITSQVPDVTGLTEADARGRLSGYFTNITTQETAADTVDIAAGTVVQMKPAPGTMAGKNQQITLYVATGSVTLPTTLQETADGQSVSQNDALLILGKLGFSSGDVQIEEVITDTMPPGMVVRVDPITGSVVSKGTPITLYIAKEAPDYPSATAGYPESTPTPGG